MSRRTWQYWTLTIPAALLVACDSGTIELSAESSATVRQVDCNLLAGVMKTRR